MKTEMFGYAINNILIQITLNKINQWNLIVYWLRKMIFAKTYYKTHNGKFLAIIKALKTWPHSLDGCIHKVVLLINYNNLYYFINKKI